MYRYQAEVLKIIDGDTVKLKVDVGFRMTFTDNFRLVGIDTPELRSKDPQEKKAAYAAKNRLEDLIPVGSTVIIETWKAGKYGRWLIDIFARIRDDLPWYPVNKILVDEGHAKVYLADRIKPRLPPSLAVS